MVCNGLRSACTLIEIQVAVGLRGRTTRQDYEARIRGRARGRVSSRSYDRAPLASLGYDGQRSTGYRFIVAMHGCLCSVAQCRTHSKLFIAYFNKSPHYPCLLCSLGLPRNISYLTFS